MSGVDGPAYGSRLGMPWTDEEVAHLKLMLAAGMSTVDMAVKLGRTPRGVRNRVAYMEGMRREYRQIFGLTFIELFGNCTPGIKENDDG